MYACFVLVHDMFMHDSFLLTHSLMRDVHDMPLVLGVVYDM
jgi:hypothetical protein